MAKQSDEFKHLLSTMPAAHAAISVVLHDHILSTHAQAQESVWPRQNIASYGIGPKKMSEHFAYIANYAAHVNLGFYQGAQMSDPYKLLEGTGASLRHIKIRTLDAAHEPRLHIYITQALRLRQNQRN